MSPEKQRIAIAEACGWKCISEKVCPPEDRINWGTIPDYLNDLNAMHEAEKVLSLARLWKYADRLNALVDGAKGKDSYICATAAQRAEAFLRTIGKWQDDS